MLTKNYLIIGGSSGIGEALTKALANDGHSVYVSYNENEISNDNNIVTFKHNVLTDDLDLNILPDCIDGLVYCPGSINLMPFRRIKPEAFISDFNLQVIGAIKTIQLLLPKLKKSETPSIVLFSTVAVQTGFNFHSQVSVSKGAIEGLTKSLAAEFSPKIRVNAIAPSLTNTPLAAKLLSSEEKLQANAERHPLKKIGNPEDIAEMAYFLLSDKSNWVTGQIMKIDGGMSSLRI